MLSAATAVSSASAVLTTTLASIFKVLLNCFLFAVCFVQCAANFMLLGG